MDLLTYVKVYIYMTDREVPIYPTSDQLQGLYVISRDWAVAHAAFSLRRYALPPPLVLTSDGFVPADALTGRLPGKFQATISLPTIQACAPEVEEALGLTQQGMIIAHETPFYKVRSIKQAQPPEEKDYVPGRVYFYAGYHRRRKELAVPNIAQGRRWALQIAKPGSDEQPARRRQPTPDPQMAAQIRKANRSPRDQEINLYVFHALSSLITGLTGFAGADQINGEEPRRNRW